MSRPAGVTGPVSRDARPILAGAGLFALVFATSGEVGATAVSSRVGLVHSSYTWDTYLGTVEVAQTLLPIDLRARSGSVDWLLGVDLAATRAEDWQSDGDLGGLAGWRIGAAGTFWQDRLRVAASGHLSGEEGPFTSSEQSLLGWITQPEIALPASRLGQGDAARAEASVRIFANRGSAAFLGASAELRGSFPFRPDGLEVDPADLMAAGGGMEQRVGPGVARLRAFYEIPVGGSLDGADAYRLGNRVRWGASAAVPAGGGALGADVELLVAESGEIEPGWVLDDTWVRGGNRVAWDVVWERAGLWSWRLGLGGMHHRGFPGALGRSDWIAPRAGATRSFGADALSVELEVRQGSVRESRDLSGVGFSLAWTREWTR